MKLLAALLLAAQPTDAPPVPSALTPYLVDGEVPAGDYRWLRGRFPGATLAEVEAFRAADHFRGACELWSKAVVKTNLAALGAKVVVLDGFYAVPKRCQQFVQPGIGPDVSWPAFTTALDKDRPYALGVLRGVTLAEDQVLEKGSLADQLSTRTVGDQALRFGWVESGKREGATADYSPLERAIYDGIITRAVTARDQANTAWLAKIVTAQGWPKRSKVGQDAANAAWLLAQHADNDPAFQLKALRLMTPLVAQKEVDPQQVAMLTDRVELKLSGKQRYGTQWTCKAGKRMPQPLTQDEAATDRLRKAAGMDSIAQNAARMDEL
ncbi:hypothetical protein COC42_07180 [Sphingomonas spermidinifaciens]|uniref:Uncharacterized protein n=1 Tax=Sphingomonas spermidinifaciens TaxID=1141889 RepID=A0A2A4B7M5_9SPHN|nr:DUF6624 domain-containing protein [Sphingomonas spermidinifaciens]PCD04080.1 hypothetical protein COC42_07180 [Sphingomonas spermidinifaciens]